MLDKVYRSVVALFFMPFYVRIFDPRTKFKGKSIAIVGPAGSALDDENGDYINSFDLVIRINKAPLNLNKENVAFLGTKMDILYHSFFENNESGGGPLDINLYEKLGLQYLITPRNTVAGLRLIFNFFKKYNRKFPVYTLPFKFYKELTKEFEKWRPTMGFCALYSVMIADFNECYITGFTFFKTPYAQGYRDELLEMDKNKAHIASHGIHNPDLEFALFLRLLNENSRKTIKMDKQLSEICRTYR